MVHSGGPPSMAAGAGNYPAQPSNPLTYLIAASPATGGARGTQALLGSNHHLGTFSLGAWRFGHDAKQPVAPASNASPARTFQPNNLLFGCTVPPPSDRRRPLLFSAKQRPAVPHRVLQPSCHVVGNGTGALPLPSQGAARFLPRPWPAATSGIAGAPPQFRANRYLWAATPPPVVPRQHPYVRAGGSAFPARGGSERARVAPVPDKSFEEFLVERGVLGGPITVAPPPNALALPGTGVGPGAVGSGRVMRAGTVSGAGRHGGLTLAGGLGAVPQGEQMGLGTDTFRIMEASGADAVGGRVTEAGSGSGAVRGRSRAAADEAKERRMRRMAKMREADARARAHTLAAARGSPGDGKYQEPSE